MPTIHEMLQRFTMHCLSFEESNNPSISQIISIANILSDRYQDDLIESCIGIHYGKRLITTKQNIELPHIHRSDIIELIDVDPVKHLVLYIGQSQPSQITPLLFMISYAKKETRHLVSFSLKKGKRKENILASWPHITCETTFLDMLKHMLTVLRNHNQLVIIKTYVFALQKHMNNLNNTY